MGWTAEWRTKGSFIDAVFLLDENGKVREAMAADQRVLSRLLTQMGDLTTWHGDTSISDGEDPEAWGQLVIARSETGEVIEVEPELFWHGIYSWFRSRGIDYDTPGLEADRRQRSLFLPHTSQLMDD